MMINLSFALNPDFTIEDELIRCNIDRIHGEQWEGEVKFKIYGIIYHDILGLFTFVRHGKFWDIEGLTPASIARQLYDDPVGRTDIRIYGGMRDRPHSKHGEYIKKYYIDSELGLRLFSDAIRGYS